MQIFQWGFFQYAARIFLFKLIDIMPADILVSRTARPSEKYIDYAG